MLDRLFVRCCEANTGENGDNIWFSDTHATFHYIGNDEVFQYCPWCGILLDVNLEMTPAFTGNKE